MEHSKAVEIANRIERGLTPYVKWIEIAGSIRRQKPDVGDIELVAIPKMLADYNLFGEKTGERSVLYDRKIFERFGIVEKCGEKYVKVKLFDGINLDLFVVTPPAQFGVIMAIRTGPAEFSHWLVTNRSKGGAMHNGWRCEDGRVWDGQPELKFDDEQGFFEWLGIGLIPPNKREPQWNRFGKTYRSPIEVGRTIGEP